MTQRFRTIGEPNTGCTAEHSSEDLHLLSGPAQGVGNLRTPHFLPTQQPTGSPKLAFISVPSRLVQFKPPTSLLPRL